MRHPNALAPLAGLCLALAGASAAVPGITIEGQASRARVEEALPGAVAAVEERLGPLDWRGTRIITTTLAEQAGKTSVPDWAAAYASPARGLVVLRTDQIGSYPWGTIQQVLIHELTHLATAKLAGAGELPRWFEEGLAMSIAQELGPADTYRLSLALLFGPKLTLASLDGRFFKDASQARSAYALSVSLVRWIEDQAGGDASRRILEDVARGVPFELAVSRIAGQPLDEVVASWQREVVLLYRWVPIFTSTVTLWIGITLLTVLAYARKRRRMEEMRARWEREERWLDGADEEEPLPKVTPGPWGPNN